MTLAAYLSRCMAEPFMWGEADCATFIINWCDACSGLSAIMAWRGQYDDEDSCLAFIAAGGGFASITDEFLGRHYGIGRAAACDSGNPLLANLAGIEAMGIRVDATSVALLLSRGVLITRRAMVLAEWEAPCRKS